MILVLDAGNTETVLGLFDGPRLRAHGRLASDGRRTADEYQLFLEHFIGRASVDPVALRGVALASVVPALTSTLSEAVERMTGLQALIVDSGTELSVRLAVDEPRTVGADRIANTLAAARLYRADTIVVDLGTATSFDVVSADGRFLGGAIMPGVRTSADRLTERTAKLPRVDLVPPEEVIGRRTEACLQAGIFYGAVDAIDGMVRRIRREWARPKATVVATGGLAPLIGDHCETVRFVDPYLTLYGLRLAHAAVHEEEMVAEDFGERVGVRRAATDHDLS